MNKGGPSRRATFASTIGDICQHTIGDLRQFPRRSRTRILARATNNGATFQRALANAAFASAHADPANVATSKQLAQF